MEQTTQALTDFTTRYCEFWQQQCGHPPASAALYGVASPCITQTLDDEIFWQPQPFTLAKNLDAIERAIGLQLQPALVAFYTTQFAGDMSAQLNGNELSLVQVWSEEDFVRVQENLIGHLVMKRRLKQTPTLFIATTESELEVISLCNLSGEVIIEQLGKNKREILAGSITDFLKLLQPVR